MKLAVYHFHEGQLKSSSLRSQSFTYSHLNPQPSSIILSTFHSKVEAPIQMHIHLANSATKSEKQHQPKVLFVKKEQQNFHKQVLCLLWQKRNGGGQRCYAIPLLHLPELCKDRVYVFKGRVGLISNLQMLNKENCLVSPSISQWIG